MEGIGDRLRAAASGEGMSWRAMMQQPAGLPEGFQVMEIEHLGEVGAYALVDESQLPVSVCSKESIDEWLGSLPNANL